MVKRNVINECDVCDVIINEIEKIHPIRKQRMDLDNFDCRSEMEVDLILHCDNDENIKSQIMFLDGNSTVKTSNGLNSYLIKDFISDDSLGKIINYLLSQFPIITNFSSNMNKISFDFMFDLKDSIYSGVSADKITLSIWTRYSNLYYKINDYLRFILTNYYDKLYNTELFKREYNKYIDGLKEEYIDSMTKDDMLCFLQDMDKSDLKNLIMGIDNDVFIEKINPNEGRKMFIKQIENGNK